MTKTVEQIKCNLCGLGIKQPLKQIFSDEEKTFCCLGCQNVFTMLYENNLVNNACELQNNDIFQKSLELGLIANSSKEINQSNVKLSPNAPVKDIMLEVSGMWCSACAWFIESVLQKQKGVINVEVFFASDLVKVKYYPQLLPLENLTKAIKDLGYKVNLFVDESNQDNEKKDLLLRLGISAFLWLNIMTLNTTLYVGYFEHVTESVRYLLPYLLMLLTFPVVFYCASPIMKIALNGLYKRTVRMETLLGLGIIAAYLYSITQTIIGGAHVYFDTASAIVTLILLGKYIERNAKTRVSQAIVLLYQMMPKKVRILVDGRENFVSVETLVVGNEFLVKAGERIPVDGIVLEGNSHTDESLLTGESLPLVKAPGSLVISGSVNKDSALKIQATKVGTDTTLSQLIQLVEKSLNQRSKLVKVVDRISQVFVPTVIVISLLTFLGAWLLNVETLGNALMRAITVLVIACPCALGMATPLAITAAIGMATRQGILVRDSSILETIYKLDTVFLDKTGTVTKGSFSLINFQLVDEKNSDFFSEYLPFLASLENASEHPLGKAIVDFAKENRKLKNLESKEIKVVKGKGIVGIVDRKSVFIGNRALLRDKYIETNDEIFSQAKIWEEFGYTVVFFGLDNKLSGIMAFGDEIKEEAEEVVTKLKKEGMKVFLVSGDALATTKTVANKIGVTDFFAEVLPEKKCELLKNIQSQGAIVAMVGDGINDAPALAQADLGIALGSGTDIAMQAASIVLMKNSLKEIISTFELAHKTWKIVRQNLFWAFLYNSLGISLAILGMLNPLMAAGAMLISSISVILNSLRLTALKEKKDINQQQMILRTNIDPIYQK